MLLFFNSSSKSKLGSRFAHFRILPSSVTNKEIPNNFIREFVISFSALTEPSHLFILDGTERNRQIVRNLAMDEPASTRSADSLMHASRQTLKKEPDSKWSIGSKVLTEEEMNAIFKGVMKGKVMFITPYLTEWNNKFAFRFSDSAYITEMRGHRSEMLGSSAVWPLIGSDSNDFEISIHSTNASILPPLPNKDNWDKIYMPKLETMEGKLELLKKEQERKKKFEDME